MKLAEDVDLEQVKPAFILFRFLFNSGIGYIIFILITLHINRLATLYL